MSKRFHIWLLFLIGLSALCSYGQEDMKVRIDSSRITQRQFEERLSEKYNGNEFDYESTVEGEAENFIARGLRWFFNKMGEWFGFDVDPTTYKVVEFFIYFILIGFTLYIIIRTLMGSKATAFFGKKSGQLAPLNVQEEHIERIDLDQFIKNALAQKDYRLAVRYMYLKALKQLSLQNIISWHFDKTNQDYYREITHSELKQDFRQVSYLYDYVWYGEFELDEEGFEKARQDFDRLTKNLRYAG